MMTVLYGNKGVVMGMSVELICGIKHLLFGWVENTNQPRVNLNDFTETSP